MKREELEQLKAHIESNANFINLGYEFAKNMIIDQVLEEKRNQMQNQYDFSRFKDVIVNSVLQQELKHNPLEEEVKESPSIKPADKDAKEGTAK
jgi:hypothetical protein